jgi:hypothetical protein
METPVWSSQPIPAVPLRTVDLFPAMLHWLGQKAPSRIDGEPVWLPQPSERVTSTRSESHLSQIHEVIGR